MSNCDNMFTNYNYINDNVIPNNNPKKTCSCNYREPFANYNAKGDIIGYYWYFGNTLTLDFNITGEVVFFPRVVFSIVIVFMSRWIPFSIPFDGILRQTT